MTKEQGETIEILKQDLELAKKEDVIDIDVLTGYLEIALNLIQEQQEENKKKDKIIDEQLKENVKLQTELNTENNRCMILANNNKFKEQMIDLMAEWISERCFYKDDYSNSCEIIQDSCNKEDDCKDCIKQYFENKAKE